MIFCISVVTDKVMFCIVFQACHGVKMSAIVNLAIGAISNKLRDYTAQKLRGGDLNHDRLRRLVVRDLDDIKSKLDALAIKELGTSLLKFKEGVTRLYISLEISDGSPASEENDEQSQKNEGATAMKAEHFEISRAERDAFKSVSELTKLIGNLKIASQERYTMAQESIKSAGSFATQALSNVALSIEDRILAGKLRVTSRVLEGLHDPEAVVHDCLNYLSDLQELPEVQAMLSVWQDSNKGIASRLRAFFMGKQRNANVESIQMINELIIDLALKFTNINKGLFTWPKIQIGTRFYHPLLDDVELLRKIEEEMTQCPWFWAFDKRIIIRTNCISDIALTSKGEILSVRDEDMQIIQKTKKDQECELFHTIFSEGENYGIIHSLAVDGNDNVYVIVARSDRYDLLILDATGNLKADRHLKEINTMSLNNRKICLTNDNLIVTYIRSSCTMLILDSANCETMRSFPVPFQDEAPSNKTDQFSITISNNDDIIFVFAKSTAQCIIVYVLSIDGELKHRVEVPLKQFPRASFDHFQVNFDSVNETILLGLFVYDHRMRNPTPYTTLLTYDSKTCEFQHQFMTLRPYVHLISHPNGQVVLVDVADAILL